MVKPITFRAGTIGRWMLRHGITLHWRHAVPFKDYDPPLAEGETAYVYLVRRGEEQRAGIFIKASKLKKPPRSNEIFESIAEYGIAYEMMGDDPAKWAAEGLGPDAMEQSKGVAQILKAFFGKEAWEELLSLAEQGMPPEPPTEEEPFMKGAVAKLAGRFERMTLLGILDELATKYPGLKLVDVTKPEEGPFSPKEIAEGIEFALKEKTVDADVADFLKARHWFWGMDNLGFVSIWAAAEDLEIILAFKEDESGLPVGRDPFAP